MTFQGPRPATEPELLRRLAGLGISDGAFLKEATLPQNFISRARAGHNRSPKASAQWDRFRDALDRLETAAGRKVAGRAHNPSQESPNPSPAIVAAGGATVAHQPESAIASSPLVNGDPGPTPGGCDTSPPAPVVPPAFPPSAQTRTVYAQGAPEGLIHQIREAVTAEQISGLARLIAELVARGPLNGGLTADVGRVLHDNLREQRQLLREKRTEEEKTSAGDELKIRIVYVNNWSGGPLPI